MFPASEDEDEDDDDAQKHSAFPRFKSPPARPGDSQPSSRVQSDARPPAALQSRVRREPNWAWRKRSGLGEMGRDRCVNARPCLATWHRALLFGKELVQELPECWRAGRQEASGRHCALTQPLSAVRAVRANPVVKEQNRPSPVTLAF